MANFFLGVNRGKHTSMNQGLIVAGTATGATDFELRVDTGKGSTKEDVLLALEAIQRYVESNGVGATVGAGVDLPPN